MERERVFRVRSTGAETTELLGQRLGQALVPGAMLALVGELGSGKTTLVRGLARGLGVEGEVGSPTFIRMRVLPGRLALYHFDAWRPGSEALLDEGREFLSGEGVAVVEWADRVEEHLPRPRLELALRHRGPEEREIEGFLVRPEAGAAPARGELAEALLSALEHAAGTEGLVNLERP